MKKTKTVHSRDEDFFEQEIQKSDLKVPYSIRAFLPKIIPFLSLSVASVFVLLQLNHSEFNLKYEDVFMPSILTPLVILSTLSYLFFAVKISAQRPKLMIVFLIMIGLGFTLSYFNQEMVISKEYLEYYLYSCLSIGLLGTFYYFLYAKTAYITMNQRCFVIHEGVFYRIEDSTDLSEVKDKDIKRNFIEILLGLSHLEIALARSIKMKIILKNISHKNIKLLYDYLLAYSFSTYREYRIASDRKKGSGKSSKDDYEDFEDESEYKSEYGDGD